MVEAALETLKAEGFAGASARSIARRGGFNQALVFYHFGSVQELLLAALDATSARRMEAYAEALEGASGIEDLFRVARSVYREDIAEGHITVLAEMLAGSVGDPELRGELVARMEPWIDFAERAVTKAVEGTVLAGMIPARDAAHAIVAFYLGGELLAHLDPDADRIERLFATAETFLPFINSLRQP